MQGSSLGVGEATEKLDVPRRFAFSFLSLCHDSAKSQLLLCGRTSAAPRCTDSLLSSDLTTAAKSRSPPSSALAHSVWTYRHQSNSSSGLCLPIAASSSPPPKSLSHVHPGLCPVHPGTRILGRQQLGSTTLHRLKGQRAKILAGKREVALASRESREEPAVPAEGMAKASSPCPRQGEKEGREKQSLAGISRDADPHKLSL